MTDLIDRDALLARVQQIADVSASAGYMLKSATLNAVAGAPSLMCENCAKYHDYSARLNACCDDDVEVGYVVDGHQPPRDFGCNHWQQRKEAFLSDASLKVPATEYAKVCAEVETLNNALCSSEDRVDNLDAANSTLRSELALARSTRDQAQQEVIEANAEVKRLERSVLGIGKVYESTVAELAALKARRCEDGGRHGHD